MDELLYPKRLTASRIRDILIILIASPIWGPVAILCTVIIKCTDITAPTIYKQRRAGKDGKVFVMYKFRTMVPNADKMKDVLRSQSTLCWPDFKLNKDPRITRVGRVLRKCSLDELPQIINVLKGEMTFIGPRPTSFLPATYEPWQTKRLDVTPGLTGMWQVAGRGVAEFDERSRIDIRYMRTRSWIRDLQIVFYTFRAVFRGQ